MPRRVVVEAPASLGNFGPGFDVTSLAVHGLGDTIELREADDDTIETVGPGAETIPAAWERNVAGATLDALRKTSGVTSRFALRIRKGQPPGSGLGSSASSAGGAALAFHALYAKERGVTPEQLVDAAGWGEAAAAGRHLDDVAAVILGGLAIVRPPTEPNQLPVLRRLQPPESLWLAIVRPDVTLNTHDMRKGLPREHKRSDVVTNLAHVALLVDACHRNDVVALGAALDDRLATPHRAAKVPGYRRAREAARRAGGHGFALAGSGPAMFSLAPNPIAAQAVAGAMREAVVEGGVGATALTAMPEAEVMYRRVLMP